MSNGIGTPRPERRQDGTAPGPRSKLLNAPAGVLMIAAAVTMTLSLYESAVLDRRFLAEGTPNTGWWCATRSIVVLALAVIILNGRIRLLPHASHVRHPLGSCGLLGGWLALAAASGSILTVAVDPAVFSGLAREDQIVEWASALALILASGFLLRAFILRWLSMREGREFGDRIVAPVLLLLAGGTFVVAMEEVSWLQRALGYEAPTWLVARSYQAEANLHNLATGSSEVIYYIGAFGLLVLLPYLGEAVRSNTPAAALSALMPSRTVIAVSAPMAAFNYDMWDILPVQLSMMTTVLVTGWCAAVARRERRRGEAWLFATTTLVVLTAQLTLFALGNSLVRLWDPTEYKELFIAGGLAAFAVEAYVRAEKRRRRQTRQRERATLPVARRQE